MGMGLGLKASTESTRQQFRLSGKTSQKKKKKNQKVPVGTGSLVLLGTRLHQGDLQAASLHT